MARKSKRARNKFRTIQQTTGDLQIQSIESAKMEITPKTRGPVSVSAMTQGDRYQYVVSELLHIGIIAGILFIILIILSFVIQ